MMRKIITILALMLIPLLVIGQSVIKRGLEVGDPDISDNIIMVDSIVSSGSEFQLFANGAVVPAYIGDSSSVTYDTDTIKEFTLGAGTTVDNDIKLTAGNKFVFLSSYGNSYIEDDGFGAITFVVNSATRMLLEGSNTYTHCNFLPSTSGSFTLGGLNKYFAGLYSSEWNLNASTSLYLSGTDLMLEDADNDISLTDLAAKDDSLWIRTDADTSYIGALYIDNDTMQITTSGEGEEKEFAFIDPKNDTTKISDMLEGGEYVFSDGVTKEAGVVTLGDTLSKNITISTADNIFTLNGGGGSSTYNSYFSLTSGEIEFQEYQDGDNNISFYMSPINYYLQREVAGVKFQTHYGEGGFYNNADYSASSNAHTLTDSLQVANMIAASGGTSSDSSSVTYTLDTLKFGDGDTRIYESADDVLRLYIGDAWNFEWNTLEAISHVSLRPSSSGGLDLGHASYYWDDLYVNEILAGNSINFGQISALTTPSKGDVYFDSDDDYLKLYNGVDYDTLNTSGSGGTSSTDTHMLIDTMFFTGRIGLGNDGDTASMQVGAVLLEIPTVQDSVVWDSIYTYCRGTSGDISIRTYELDSPSDGSPTAIHAEINPVTGTPTGTSTFTTSTSPPGKIIQQVITAVTTKPTMVVTYLFYHEKRTD